MSFFFFFNWDLKNRLFFVHNWLAYLSLGFFPNLGLVLFQVEQIQVNRIIILLHIWCVKVSSEKIS